MIETGEAALLVAGVDGCAGGWVAALLQGGAVRVVAVRQLAEVLELGPEVIAVDMPIGLAQAAEPGGRACDRAARKLLGPRRASVFSPPCRPALAARSYAEALVLNRTGHGVGLSKQCYNLFPKLREVDGLLTPKLQLRVREVHPELAFARMACGEPCVSPKRTAHGQRERLERLTGQGFDEQVLHEILGCGRALRAKPDDILDAVACAWSARRIAHGQALRLPEGSAVTDARGLAMEILA